MTDATSELAKIREEAGQIADELGRRNATIGLADLAQQTAELAGLIAAVAYHTAGEIKNRRLATQTP